MWIHSVCWEVLTHRSIHKTFIFFLEMILTRYCAITEVASLIVLLMDIVPRPFMNITNLLFRTDDHFQVNEIFIFFLLFVHYCFHFPSALAFVAHHFKAPCACTLNSLVPPNFLYIQPTKLQTQNKNQQCLFFGLSTSGYELLV